MRNEYEKEVEQASFYGGLRTDCSLESGLGAWHSGRPHQSGWCQLGLASPAFVSDPCDNQPSQLDPTSEYDVTPTRRHATCAGEEKMGPLLSVSQVLRGAQAAGCPAESSGPTPKLPGYGTSASQRQCCLEP